MAYLCADIGGTKTWVAAIQYEGSQIKILREKKYVSREYESLEAILKLFQQEGSDTFTAACFGLAGVIKNNESHTTNLPWFVSGKKISEELSIADVFLINDLEAHAYGILTLDASELEILSKGAGSGEGAKALIAAGTGMGMAQIFTIDNKPKPQPSEGGHMDFAAQTEVERELCSYLSKKFDHVSIERVCSGIGLLNLYQFVIESGKAKESASVKEEMQSEDHAKVITKRAIDGSCPACRYTLDLFISIYGAAAGNLALVTKATGGIYIAGGIAPKILQELKKGSFLNACISKGRFSDFVKSIPVKVVLNDKTALLGTAYFCKEKEINNND